MLPAARHQTAGSASVRTFSSRSIGRVAVLIWHTEVTVEGARAIANVFAELKKDRSASGFGFLTVLEAGVDIRPSPEARQAVAQVLTDYGSDIRAAAVAYEASGFKATIVRSAITAINIASSTRFPNRVFSGTPRAIDWLALTLGDATIAASLRNGVDQMRRVSPGASGTVRSAR